MVQVKEFLNGQEGQDTEINNWLKDMDGSIEIIDIKYSVSTFQSDTCGGAREYSGVLVVYKTK